MNKYKNEGISLVFVLKWCECCDIIGAKNKKEMTV